MFAYVREADKQNTGLRVEGIQRWCGGVPGDSYCAFFVTLVLDICFQGAAPIERQGSCDTIYRLGKSKGWITDKPEIGDLFFFIDDNDHAHHIGIVTGLNPLTGIAGNTSADGRSSNGTGVYEHTISAKTFLRVPC